MRSTRALLSNLVVLGLTLLAAGCGIVPPQPASAVAGPALHGKAFGGQQPVSGSRVYLLGANSTGYAQPSVSLLDPAITLQPPDSIGSFVTTDSNGIFSIGGDYVCTSGQQVYLYASGGDPGSGPNPSIGLMAVLGDCTAGTFAAQYPFVQINEATTIAAAYALSGFATDAIHISSSGTPLALTAIANAFQNAANLASIITGQALDTTPNGTGTVPQATLNTLANILAACVNTDGTITGPTQPTPCYTLLNSALSAGLSGTPPSDTATAAINIAHHPAANVGALFALPTPTAPFSPALNTQPNDFTIALTFAQTGGRNIAIDASGDIWVSQPTGILELDPSGTLLSPDTGYTGGGTDAGATGSPSDGLGGIAIDLSGNVWAANRLGNTIVELSSAGTPLSPSTGYTGGGLYGPGAVSIDGLGNVWVTNVGSSISELSSSGTPLSPDPAGFTGGGLLTPIGIAVDSADRIWVAGSFGLSKFNNNGTPITNVNPYTGGGLSAPSAVAIDGSNDAWAVNRFTGNTVSELANNGNAISGAHGYPAGNGSYPSIAIDGAGAVWTLNATSVNVISKLGAAISPSPGYTVESLTNPVSLAIDGSGNVWAVNGSPNYAVVELVGAATPVVTPIAAGVANHTLATRP